MEDYRLKLYLETTVFNWYFDPRPGHEEVVKLFEAIKAGKFIGYTSHYVTDELKKAGEPKKSNMLSLIQDYDIIPTSYSPQAEALARKYISAGIIPASHFYDSVHIAFASLYELDAVVSYNFPHINRDKARKLTALVNVQEGYSPVIICTAEEVLKYGGNS